MPTAPQIAWIPYPGLQKWDALLCCTVCGIVSSTAVKTEGCRIVFLNLKMKQEDKALCKEAGTARCWCILHQHLSSLNLQISAHEHICSPWDRHMATVCCSWQVDLDHSALLCFLLVLDNSASQRQLLSEGITLLSVSVWHYRSIGDSLAVQLTAYQVSQTQLC